MSWGSPGAAEGLLGVSRNGPSGHGFGCRPLICAALWRISFRPPRGLGRAENPEHRSKTIQTSTTPRPSLAPPEGQTFAFGAAGNANVHIERRVRARVGRPAVTVSDWPAQLVRLQRGLNSEQLAASRFEGGFRARGGGGVFCHESGRDWRRSGDTLAFKNLSFVPQLGKVSAPGGPENLPNVSRHSTC